jgi:glycosyltransferase involved in cell wall biosynthesis
VNKVKYIIHLPSWYPTKNKPYNGIFIRNLISTLSNKNLNYKHLVINWHENNESPLRNFNTFLVGFWKSFKKPTLSISDDIEYAFLNYFHSNQYLFGSNIKRLEKKIYNLVKDLQKNREIILIHAHVSFPGGVIAKNISSQLGIKYIISEHMSPFPFAHFSSTISSNIFNAIKKAESTIAVSNSHKNEIFLKTNIIPVVIPNVILSNEFTLAPNIINNNTFNFLSISIISEQKGIDILIKAASILRKITKTNFTITIIGEGPIKNKLLSMCIELNMHNNFIWKGFHSRLEIQKDFNNCNALVCSSLHESFGVTLVEAMASGRPIVSTKCGGPEDIVNNETGILVNNNTPYDLANAMLKMMEDINKFSPENLRKIYLSKYSELIIQQKYNKLYNQICFSN